MKTHSNAFLSSLNILLGVANDLVTSNTLFDDDKHAPQDLLHICLKTHNLDSFIDYNLQF